MELVNFARSPNSLLCCNYYSAYGNIMPRNLVLRKQMLSPHATIHLISWTAQSVCTVMARDYGIELYRRGCFFARLTD